jgi:hypothetical protein
VQFEIGTQESKSQLGNEFFAAVTFIAPVPAAKVTGAVCPRSSKTLDREHRVE